MITVLITAWRPGWQGVVARVVVTADQLIPARICLGAATSKGNVVAICANGLGPPIRLRAATLLVAHTKVGHIRVAVPRAALAVVTSAPASAIGPAEHVVAAPAVNGIAAGLPGCQGKLAFPAVAADVPRFALIAAVAIFPRGQVLAVKAKGRGPNDSRGAAAPRHSTYLSTRNGAGASRVFVFVLFTSFSFGFVTVPVF